MPTCTTTAAACPGVTGTSGTLKRIDVGWLSSISAVCPETSTAVDLPARPFPLATISSPGIPTSGVRDVTFGAADTLKNRAFERAPRASTVTLTSAVVVATASGIVTAICVSVAERIVPAAGPNRTTSLAGSVPKPEPETVTVCPASAFGGTIEASTGGGA